MTYIKDVSSLAEMVWKASALAEDLMHSDSKVLEKVESDLNKIYSDLIYYKADLLIEGEE